MYITLKMKIQDQEFDLNVNLANRAGRIYRQQYGRDILRDMTDLYKKLNKSPFEGIDMTGIDIKGKTEQEIYDDLLSHVDMAKFLESRTNSIGLDFEETERAGQIIWAFV